jgi:hypothetical protein
VDKGDGEYHSLKVREDPKLGPFVDGLSSHTVLDFESMDALMAKGNAMRTTAVRFSASPAAQSPHVRSS